VSVIILGAWIGSWVDKSSRLKAAQVFLSIQNVVVAVCCAFLAAFFWDNFNKVPIWLICSGRNLQI
jgi:hypothetical protein